MYMILGPGRSGTRRLFFLSVVTSMVVLQMLATIAISISVLSPSCNSGSDCPNGRYCGTHDGHKICMSCVQPAEGINN